MSTATTRRPRRSSRKRRRPTRCCRTPSGGPPMTATGTMVCAAAATRRTSRASGRWPTSSRPSLAAAPSAAPSGVAERAVSVPAGGDVAVGAEISLAEAASGTQTEVAFDAIELCEHCHGNGAEPGTPIETCPRCQGTGQLRAVTRTPFGQMVRATACDVCGGDGRVPKEPCHVCHGRGTAGPARHAVGRCSGRNRGWPAHPHQGARPRGRAWRPRGRPVRPGPGQGGPAVRPQSGRPGHRRRRLGPARGAGDQGRGANDRGHDRARDTGRHPAQ